MSQSRSSEKLPFASGWVRRVERNIFPLSEEKSELIKAMREWLYHGVMNDLHENERGGADEERWADCELCDHPNIRYQFEIKNQHNQNSLLIGSECITKFDGGIQVVDTDGNLVSGEAAKRKVDQDRNKLIQAAQTRSVINSIIKIGQQDDKFDFEGFVKQYQNKGSFTPKQIALLEWKLNENGISHKPGYFKMSMRKNAHKDQLEKMEDWKLRKIWRYLSPHQKKWVQEMRRKQGRPEKEK